jgi:hypothetical protein
MKQMSLVRILPPPIVRHVKKKKKKKLTGGYQRIAANIIFIREIIIAHLLYIIFLN